MGKPFVQNKTKRNRVYNLRRQGKTYKEIAEEMGVSYSTVRNAYLEEKKVRTESVEAEDSGDTTSTTTTTLPCWDDCCYGSGSSSNKKLSIGLVFLFIFFFLLLLALFS